MGEALVQIPAEAAAALALVRRAIDDQGRRMDWVAAQVACTSSHLNGILLGRRRLTPARAQALARVLDLPVDRVLPACAFRPVTRTDVLSTDRGAA